MDNLLQVENICVSFEMYETDKPYFRAKKVNVPVLKDINLSIHAGEVVCVVGESGAGKSVLIDTILDLNPINAKVSGNIWINGVKQTSETLRKARGHNIAYVPQSVNALNPYRKVGTCIGAPLFSKFGLSADIAKKYPHQLSGGQVKRVLLTCALANNPRIILVDEVTSGLDEENANNVISHIRRCAQGGCGVLLVTHDIHLSLKVADKIAVFYKGHIVEETSSGNFYNPALIQHAYTRALYHALPENEFEVRDVCDIEETGKKANEVGEACENVSEVKNA